jgi:hypothetical protein
VGEIIGENLYRDLACRASQADQILKLNAIADVERLTHQRLRPIADRLGIEPDEAEWRTVVARRTHELATLTWYDFIAQSSRDWPPYIERFESLMPMAPGRTNSRV